MCEKHTTLWYQKGFTMQLLTQAHHHGDQTFLVHGDFQGLAVQIHFPQRSWINNKQTTTNMMLSFRFGGSSWFFLHRCFQKVLFLQSAPAHHDCLAKAREEQGQKPHRQNAGHLKPAASLLVSTHPCRKKWQYLRLWKFETNTFWKMKTETFGEISRHW